jgi:hypothetical protein
MWIIINLLLTLGKRYIVKQGTIDYFLLTWAYNVFCYQVSQTIKYFVILKKKKQYLFQKWYVFNLLSDETFIIPPLHRRGGILSFRPSQDIFCCIFLSNYWWQKSDIWSQASYRGKCFLDPSDSYFLFADLVGFYTHWTYMWGYHKWALSC